MSVKFRCWSEDGEEVIDVPESQLVSQFASQQVPPPQKPATSTTEEFSKWTMPDEPDRYADFA